MTGVLSSVNSDMLLVACVYIYVCVVDASGSIEVSLFCRSWQIRYEVGISGVHIERRRGGEIEIKVNQRERQVEVILAVARASCQEGPKGKRVSSWEV